jgi:TPP-dependent 2-oxoacid decarboxylase
MAAHGDEAGMVRVGDYLIERLRAHGVDHVFGVPGDFVLGFMQDLEESPLKLITTCDEQGAGFAADAYARLRGLGVVCVTYGVGGLKVTNTTGQAYAEESPVLVISGAPSLSERRRHPLLHHKVRTYDTQFKVFQHLTAAAAVLDTPEDALREIDRVLGTVRRRQRPGYIELPRDIVDHEVPRVPPLPTPPDESDPRTLAAALAEATEWIARARQPVIVLGVELYRFDLVEPAMRFVDRSGIPTTVSLLDKSAIDERHPSFIGVYAGALGRPEVQEYVEGSDCLIRLGTLPTDINLGIYTAHLDPARSVEATHDRLAIGLHTYERVRLADFVEGLARAELPRRTVPDHPRPPTAVDEPAGTPPSPPPLEGGATPPSPPPLEGGVSPDDPVTVAGLFRRLGTFLSEGLIVLADPGDALFAAIDLPVYEARDFLAPAFYASLGFAVPAAIGAQLAYPDERPLVLVGDGAFQMTGMELSTCARYGLDPIVIVLNNGGYTTERLILDGAFNDIQRWDYSKLPDVIGAGRAHRVETVGDDVMPAAARVTSAGPSTDRVTVPLSTRNRIGPSPWVAVEPNGSSAPGPRSCARPRSRPVWATGPGPWLGARGCRRSPLREGGLRGADQRGEDRAILTRSSQMGRDKDPVAEPEGEHEEDRGRQLSKRLSLVGAPGPSHMVARHHRVTVVIRTKRRPDDRHVAARIHVLFLLDDAPDSLDRHRSRWRPLDRRPGHAKSGSSLRNPRARPPPATVRFAASGLRADAGRAFSIAARSNATMPIWIDRVPSATPRSRASSARTLACHSCAAW